MIGVFDEIGVFSGAGVFDGTGVLSGSGVFDQGSGTPDPLADIPGKIAWFAQEDVDQALDSPVASWPNRIAGFADLAQATGLLQPTRKSDGIQYDASDLMSAPFDPLAGDGMFYMWSVHRTIDPGSITIYFRSTVNDNRNQMEHFVFLNQISGYRLAGPTTVEAKVISTEYGTGKNIIAEFRSDSGAPSIRDVIGAVENTAAAAPGYSDFNEMRVTCSGAFVSKEIFVVQGVTLTSDQLNIIRNYFLAKYP